MVAPAVDNVALGHRGQIGRPAVLHGQPVQVAAVLGGQLGDERRPIERHEAVAVADRGEAAEQRVDEQQPPVGVDRQIVDVEVAGDVALPRHVEPVMALVELARGERVLEPPDLVERADMQARRSCATMPMQRVRPRR